jgi:phosphonopyruvate decarboxylase
MLNTNWLGNELKELGYQFYTGVPCSYLKDLINYAINHCEYVAATNEGEAVSIASGASLGKRKAVVLMQNSGLTNAVSPLTSLNYTFQLPVLGFVSLRGEKGVPDEPQHELMGQITTKMLELMEIEWEFLATNEKVAKEQITRANERIEKGQTFFFIVKKATFEKEKLLSQPTKINTKLCIINKSKQDELPTRFNVLQVINQLKDRNSIHLATTGKTGRELNHIEDAPNNLYMVGSMGCVSSIGLGLALSQRDKDIIAIDGDGALLMRFGNLATNGYYAPSNLLHILLDNNTHDSTGGQSTVSQNIDFIQAASACGYPIALYAHNLLEFKEYITHWKEFKGLTFLYIKISKGSLENLGRPKVSPIKVKERLQSFLEK